MDSGRTGDGFSLRRLHEVLSVSTEFLWLVFSSREKVLDGRRLLTADHAPAPHLGGLPYLRSALVGCSSAMKRNVGPFVLALCLLITPAEDENHGLICNEPLSKEVGDNVTLECHHATGLNVMDQSVYWQFNNSIHVLVFKSRGFSPDDQGEQFKGRASEDSSWNPAEGNLSVKISSIKRADAGTYTCSVGKKKMSCSTELSIGALDGARSPDPDDPGNPANNTGLTNGGMGVICLIIGIGIGIVSVIVIMIICRILESFTNRHRGTPPPTPPPPSSSRVTEEHLQPL